MKLKLQKQFSHNIINILNQNNNYLNLCVYKNNKNSIQSQCLTNLILENNEIFATSIFYQFLIKDKSYEIECLVRKLRNEFRQTYKEKNENTFINKDVTIEIIKRPKQRDKNGVVRETPFSSVFILVYDNFTKETIKVLDFKNKSNDRFITTEPNGDINIYNYLDYETTILNHVSLLENQ